MCVERETGFEPATSTLARWSSTTELLPRINNEAVPYLKLPRKFPLREKGFEPIRPEAPDPKSGVSANFTTLAVTIIPKNTIVKLPYEP